MNEKDLLTAEEAFIWACARHWQSTPPLPTAPLNWDRVVALGVANKMATLVARAVDTAGVRPSLAPASVELLDGAVARLEEKAATYSQLLPDYLRRAHAAGLPTLPLKGLWVGCQLYGDRTLRPGHDMDVLVTADRIDDCIAVAESMGFGRYWPDQLADAFYRRHHLHLELCLPDRWTWIEIHWALDHPRTRLTIDYPAMIDRARPGELLGAPVLDPAPEDVLLTLTVHLVKHAVYLPATLQRDDLPRIILGDGRLLNFLDIAVALAKYEGEIDWEWLVALCRASGATTMMGAVLRVCADHFDAPVPEMALAALAVDRPGALNALLLNKMADSLVAALDGRSLHPLWRFLVDANDTFVFRPIRLLDMFSYAWPGTDYLQRRYGRAGRGTAVAHFGRSVGQYLNLAADTLNYAVWQRNKPLPPFTTRPAPVDLPF